MKKGFFLTVALLFLSSCTNKAGTQKFFIDSNVTADVYIGDVKIGSTPFEQSLTPEQTPLLNLRKDGYKPANVKVSLTKYRNPLLDTTSSKCRNDGWCEGMTIAGTLVFAVGIGLTITTKVEIEESGYYRYAQNAFYVEMIPLKKKMYSLSDLKNLQIKEFILQNYAPLRVGNTEYILALEKLAGSVPVRPLPDQTAPQYVNAFMAEQ